MRPVFEEIARAPGMALDLIVTGMHLAPRFGSSLAEIEGDHYGALHRVDVGDPSASGSAMAQALGRGVIAMAQVIAAVRPDVVLVQGDRGEMLAGAIAAAHQNAAVVHMSGGDQTGSIDESIRSAITGFAHVHLTTCAQSTARLIARGETPSRVFEVGEPALDVIRRLQPVPAADLAAEFDLDLSRPIVLATQHPVTTEAEQAGWQLTQTLTALELLGLQTVFTYPNTDAGGEAMVRVLESYATRPFLRVAPHLGSTKYMSLMKIAAVMVGNSSSGILEAASFALPVVNIGTRQHGRMRAGNVMDVGYDSGSIRSAVEFAIENSEFRSGAARCVNPYGDGTTAVKTLDILRRLRLTPALLAKWLPSDEPLLA